MPLRFGAAWEPRAAFQYRWTSFRDGGSFGLAPQDGFLPLAVGERSAREWTVRVSVIVRLSDTERLPMSLRKAFGGS